MSVGFTGTRQGVTDSQAKAVKEYLDMLLPRHGNKFRHGVCNGADLQCAAIAVSIGYEEARFPAGDDPLGRDRIIVDGADFMLATPNNFKNIIRGSGTWYTIRYAARVHVPGVIIWPDGMSSPITVRRHPYYDSDEG